MSKKSFIDFTSPIFSGELFERLCADIFSVYQNIDLNVSIPGKDGGIDFSSNDRSIIGQVKRYENKISDSNLKAEAKKIQELKSQYPNMKYFFCVAQDLSEGGKEKYAKILEISIDSIYDKNKLYQLLISPTFLNNYRCKRWEDKLAEISLFFQERKYKKEVEVWEKRYNISQDQLDKTISILEIQTKQKQYPGISIRQEETLTQQKGDIFTIIKEGEFETYQAIADLNIEQLPQGKLRFDFSDDGEKVKNDLKSYFNGEKDEVKVPVKFILLSELKLQGDTLFSENPSLYPDSDKTYLWFAQPRHRSKFLFFAESFTGVSSIAVESDTWYSVEEGGLVIESVPEFEKPMFRFRFSIKFKKDGNCDIKINYSINHKNIHDIFQAVEAYNLYQAVSQGKFKVLQEFTKNNFMELFDVDKTNEKSIDEKDLVEIDKILKRFGILQKVASEFQTDLLKLDVYNGLISPDTKFSHSEGKVIAFLEKAINEKHDFPEFFFSPSQEAKKTLIPGFLGHVDNFEIGGLELFGVRFRLRVRGMAELIVDKEKDKYGFKFKTPSYELVKDVYSNV